ncbi:arylsulfatase [Aquimarina sp. D1M17]|uniref:arylsulfatase n=1 Tax=Aquimarina acroporae TaxID=2937283 RepID=UPI0020C14700|nr:arylsulfatase [Aquimarina acroporae]MCK8521810.1 arylsulfatase [Aquimarina acroporae]
MKSLTLKLVVFSFVLVGCKTEKVKFEKPNILFIVTDDMGYSDFSPFGGEINTPNLQKLASEGVRISNFYTAPTCSPARSMLLTGVDNHLNGLGAMDEFIIDMTPHIPALRERDGYLGALNDSVMTIPEVLVREGYQSFISGKWHLGEHKDEWPYTRGFDKSYVLLQGASSHTGSPLMPITKGSLAELVENDMRVNPRKDFYSSLHFTDKFLDYLKERDKAKPFFGYLAFTAPHDPLECPEEYSDKYKGLYDSGYDKLRVKRYQELVKLGIFQKDITLGQKLAPSWESLSEDEKLRLSKSMEVYAGMIDFVDEQIGRVFEYLKSTNQYNNTIIVFLSDNGSAYQTLEEYSDSSPEYIKNNFDTSFDNIGRNNSAASIGEGWAQASMSPFRFYKGKTGEGGIRTPAIIKWNGMSKELKGTIDTEAIGHIYDLAPTLYELIGVNYSKLINTDKVHSLSGKSLVPFLKGDSANVHTDYLGWELHGNKALRKGKWKILWVFEPGNNHWELYDIVTDPGETKDLSKVHTSVFQDLLNDWEEYTTTKKIINLF